MTKRMLWLLPVVLCMGATECEIDDDLGPEEDVAFRTLEYADGADVEGDESGIIAKQLLVIRDADTFAAFWEDHSALMSPQPAQPEVDFETDMVIAAFMGERETSGYRIEIESVRENDAFMIVEVEMQTPGDNCTTNEVLTQPHQVIVLDDSDKPVQFSESTVEAAACATN